MVLRSKLPGEPAFYLGPILGIPRRTEYRTRGGRRIRHETRDRLGRQVALSPKQLS
jgi:hypothetical protein